MKALISRSYGLSLSLYAKSISRLEKLPTAQKHIEKEVLHSKCKQTVLGKLDSAFPQVRIFSLVTRRNDCNGIDFLSLLLLWL
jgi:hypothetical protein